VVTEEIEIEPVDPGPGGIIGLVRAPLQAVVRISGLDAVAHAIDRLAKSADRAAEVMDRIDADRLDRLAMSAERAAEILDRIDAERLDHLASSAERAAALLEQVESEIGIEGARRTLASLDNLSVVIEEMNRSLHSIEDLANELRGLASVVQRLPSMPRLRRGRGADRAATTSKT
jgi:methyl-accepting chemotaxis protein